MNWVLWIIAVVLALVFLGSGIQKLVSSSERLKVMKWASGLSLAMIRGTGVLELIGAVGLILPALTGVLPWLTPLAAVGLVGLMLGAGATNYRLGLYPAFAFNLLLLVLAAFLAYGRFVLAPFSGA